MPHCELRYSSDLNTYAEAILNEVEASSVTYDGGAVETKSRAYPAPIFHHTHPKAPVALPAKWYRGAAFTSAFQKNLVKRVAAHLTLCRWLSVDITLSAQTYHTEFLE
ncbi:MAG: hypothetical protein AAGK77_04500 [Pseudomonadota bacterium]